ncbi:MAG TPA: hypothetical protein VHW74_06170 [Mycobacteriales bacterium]|nr:hypothetical protein [Mycobacteriales bacterium]
MANRRGSVVISSLESHPNALEILGITSRLPCITDDQLIQLAAVWENTSELGEARRHALEPDSPLVFEALSRFETVQVLFAEEIRGGEEYLGVEPDAASTALKAIRDAIAAAYARPAITPAEHSILTRAWRAVYPNDRIATPDLGSRPSDVTSLLHALPRLAAICHDPIAAEEYAAILDASMAADEDIHWAAREEAWHAAVLTSRRRMWWLIRHTADCERARYCLTCRERERSPETERVLTFVADAACGLLVSGSLDEDIVEVLTTPVGSLIPAHRPADS